MLSITINQIQVGDLIKVVRGNAPVADTLRDTATERAEWVGTVVSIDGLAPGGEYITHLEVRPKYSRCSVTTWVGSVDLITLVKRGD